MKEVHPPDLDLQNERALMPRGRVGGARGSHATKATVWIDISFTGVKRMLKEKAARTTVYYSTPTESVSSHRILIFKVSKIKSISFQISTNCSRHQNKVSGKFKQGKDIASKRARTSV